MPAPSVVCRAHPPYEVVYANKEWECLTGYTLAETLGCSLRRLQGPGTDRGAVELITKSVQSNMAVVIPALINYRKTGQAFAHCVSATPLSSAAGDEVMLARITSTPVQYPSCYDSLTCDAFTSDITTDEELDIEQGKLFSSDSVDTTLSTLQEMASSATRKAHTWLETSAMQLYTSPFKTDPCVVTSAEPPYTILWANPTWLDLCDFHAAEVVGLTLSCIQGSATDPFQIRTLMAHVETKASCTITRLINYTKDRRPFRHTLHVSYVPSPAEDVRAVFCSNSTDVMLYQAQHCSTGQRSMKDADGRKPVTKADSDATKSQIELEEEADAAAQAAAMSHMWNEDLEDFLASLECFADLSEQMQTGGPSPRCMERR